MLDKWTSLGNLEDEATLLALFLDLGAGITEPEGVAPSPQLEAGGLVSGA